MPNFIEMLFTVVTSQLVAKSVMIENDLPTQNLLQVKIQNQSSHSFLNCNAQFNFGNSTCLNTTHGTLLCESIYEKDFSMSDSETEPGWTSYIVILRIFRVVRVMKLSRRSHKLTLMAKTVGSSIKELSCLVIVIGFATILFSTFMYFAEHNIEKTDFTSIPSCFWYCVVTMTTVGYGK